MYWKSILLDLLELKKKQSVLLISFYPRIANGNSFDHRTCSSLNIFFCSLKADTCCEYFKFHGRNERKHRKAIRYWQKLKYFGINIYKEICKLRRNYERYGIEFISVSKGSKQFSFSLFEFEQEILIR